MRHIAGLALAGAGVFLLIPAMAFSGAPTRGIIEMAWLPGAGCALLAAGIGAFLRPDRVPG